MNIKYLLIGLAVLSLSCKPAKLDIEKTVVDFSINLNDRSNDTFKVTVNVEDLSNENSIFQFAATAPGTYKVMDIGRFVSNFKAFDRQGNVLATKKKSVNQFELSSPEKITEITYEIAETFDSPIKENSVYLMCGTSIENDHVLINGQAVFGYFKGKQAAPIRVTLHYPKNWKLGTALNKDKEGRYLAQSYDHIVDSPILLGELSVASSKVGNTAIDVYTFSQNNVVHSGEILSSMNDMLIAADKFMYGLPVDRYTFLYYFDDKDAGAWEHSYSSEYILREDKWENIEEFVKHTAAHEFFHIITPLNIHSEIIEQFNFVEPVPSKHLWLYEATTEWAAGTMLLRSNQISIEDYFGLLHAKADANQFFDKSYSLEQLALKSYTKEGQQQYTNIYHRGSLIMELLNIELLALSNGENGLRELMYELIEKYGVSKPFDEETFYDEIVAMTYPQIEQFFESYIRGAKPLPYKEMFKKVGIHYQEKIVDDTANETGLRYYLGEQGFVILKCSPPASLLGFQEGDILKYVDGQVFNLDSIDDIKKKWSLLKPNETYTATIIRDQEELTITAHMFPKVTHHVFTLDKNATPKAKHLFNAWSKRL